MTEAEILAEISLITTAIQNIYTTGQNYEVGTGASKRIFAAANYDSLTKQRTELYRDLANIDNPGGGVMLGY